MNFEWNFFFQNVNAFKCPTTYPEQCTDDVNTKPGQIIDSNGCLVWTCVPDQPYCCQYQLQVDAVTLTKCSADSELVQVLDPKTGCKRWQCAPKQPYCCGVLEIKRECAENSYKIQVYDLKTGCLVWDCATCPEAEELACCLIGYPCKGLDANGCPQWSCCSYETPIEIHEFWRKQNRTFVYKKDK